MNWVMIGILLSKLFWMIRLQSLYTPTAVANRSKFGVPTPVTLIERREMEGENRGQKL